MEMIIKKKVGKNSYTFVVNGDNLYQLTMESQKLSFGDIDKCGCTHKDGAICGSDNLILNARLAKNKFQYVEIKCLSCKGALIFGNVADTDKNTYYLRKDKATKAYAWKSYDPDTINE